MSHAPVILLVEDEDADIILFREAVRRARGETFELVVITDFFDVLKRAKEHPEPALILVDAKLQPKEPGETQKDGRELVDMLNRDPDIRADVYILTGQPKEPGELDKSQMQTMVIPVVQQALAPRKATPEDNQQEIRRIKQSMAYDKDYARKGFQAVHDEMKALSDKIDNQGPRLSQATIAFMCGTVSLLGVLLLIGYMTAGMSIQSLSTRFKYLQVNVNSEQATEEIGADTADPVAGTSETE